MGEQKGPPKTKSPVSNVPTTEHGDAAGAGCGEAGSRLCLEGLVCVWVRGRWKPRPKETAPHSGLGALQRLVCCVVWR